MIKNIPEFGFFPYYVRYLFLDGIRVLGLGNIGPEGALPVLEGKICFS
jgi:hypothetical protein